MSLTPTFSSTSHGLQNQRLWNTIHFSYQQVMVNRIKGFGNVNKHDISKAIRAIYGLTNHIEILIDARVYF